MKKIRHMRRNSKFDRTSVEQGQSEKFSQCLRFFRSDKLEAYILWYKKLISKD